MIKTDCYNKESEIFAYFSSVLSNVTVGDYELWLCESMRGTFYLQIRFEEKCNFGQEEILCLQCCRKWMLDYGMSATEIVRTAYKAYEAAVIHETQEKFLYKGFAIFNPHTDVERLCDKDNKVKETN